MIIRITEGLHRGDLADLVKPLISVDEYESKLGDDVDVIVVAFFVADEDPAIDLSKFIEHGHNESLDCEVSPAPNENGAYMVFVEFSRTSSFPEDLQQILDEIKGLVQIEEWHFKPYRVKKPLPLTKRNIERHVCLDKQKLIKRQKEKATEERIATFLSSSNLDGVCLRGNILEMITYTGMKRFEMVDFGEIGHVLKRRRLTESPISIHEQEMTALQDWLGGGWWANRLGDYIAVSRRGDDTLLLLAETHEDE